MRPAIGGLGGGRFFINGVDTRTEGVDVVMSYPLETALAGRFDFTLAANFNSTDVTKVPQITLAGVNPPPVLFTSNLASKSTSVLAESEISTLR